MQTEKIFITHLLSHAKRLYLKKNCFFFFFFPENSAPTHRSKTMQARLRANCPEFIKQEDRPHSSPDLNLFDTHFGSHKSFDSLRFLIA